MQKIVLKRIRLWFSLLFEIAFPNILSYIDTHSLIFLYILEWAWTTKRLFLCYLLVLNREAFLVSMVLGVSSVLTFSHISRLSLRNLQIIIFIETIVRKQRIMSISHQVICQHITSLYCQFWNLNILKQKLVICKQLSHQHMTCFVG